MNKTLELAQSICDIYTVKRKKPRIVLDSNFKVKSITISSSLLRKMFFKTNIRDFCPFKLYKVDIVFEYDEPPTRAMQNGLYFESGVLGMTADGTPWRSLTRKRNGSKTVENLRIDQQIINARAMARDHGIIINKEGRLKNVQVQKTITFTDYDKDGIEVFLHMTLDLVTPLELSGISYPGVIIDLKLTQNLQTDFGEFCWNKPHLMDHTQAFIYSFYLDMPFFYWVFDYPPKDMSSRFVPINTNLNHPDRVKAAEARIRFQETHELIRTAINILLEYSKHGWPTNPTYDNCKTCPILTCQDRGKNQDI